ncbi:MAG: GNAT family N-acetyltransferase [Alloacidobacterium sp.]|jgi:ribosomal protein S18 acetylase RimI-like enzyme
MNATIRQAGIHDAAEIARVHVDSWRTTYKGIVPQEYLDSLSREARTESWNNQISSAEARILVLEDESRIFGFACGGKLREPIGNYDAEIYAIYLLSEYQNRGYGRSLTQHLAKHLVQSGFLHLAVWVLAENPSCGFYVRLGGERIAEKPIQIGRAQLVEVAYGWRNIEELASPNPPPPQ